MRELDIIQHGTGGGNFGTAETAKGIECRRAEEALQALPGVVAVEARGRERRQAFLVIGEIFKQRRTCEKPIGQQDFRGIEPRRDGGKVALARFLNEEAAGRDVDPGESHLATGFGEGTKEIMAPRLEERILSQGPWCDNARDIAPDDGFRAALLRLRRVLHLLADSDLKTLAHQFRHIGVVGVDRHAAHRNVLARMFAALGEGDVERRCRLHGVVEKHLVEIAHAVEDQRVRMPALGREILHHHRRRIRRFPRPDGRLFRGVWRRIVHGRQA